MNDGCNAPKSVPHPWTSLLNVNSIANLLNIQGCNCHSNPLPPSKSRTYLEWGENVIKTCSTSWFLTSLLFWSTANKSITRCLVPQMKEIQNIYQSFGEAENKWKMSSEYWRQKLNIPSLVSYKDFKMGCLHDVFLSLTFAKQKFKNPVRHF